MRNLIIAAALTFGAFSTVSPAAAEDCNEMKAQMSEEQIWVCRLAYNDGQKAKHKVGCFANEAEGFTWMGHASGGATGTIYQGSCTRDGKLTKYVDYVNR